MSKHTPAPWFIDSEQEMILNANGIPVVYELNTNDADARLIAASPTMYEYIEKQAIAGCEFASKILEGINATR